MTKKYNTEIQHKISTHGNTTRKYNTEIYHKKYNMKEYNRKMFNTHLQREVELYSPEISMI